MYLFTELVYNVHMHNTSVLIHPALHRALKERATLQRRSMNYLVAIAISEKMADEAQREAYWRPHRGGVPQNISVPPDVRALTAGRRGGLTGFVLDALGTYLGVEEPVEEPIAGENPDGPLGRISTFDVATADLEAVKMAMCVLRVGRTTMLRRILADWARAWRLEHGDTKAFGCATGCGKLVEVEGNFCRPCHDEVHGVAQDPQPAVTATPARAPKGVTPADYTGPRCANCYAALPSGGTSKVCPKCVVEMAARVAARVPRPAVATCAICRVKPDTGGGMCDDCAPVMPAEAR